MPGARCTRGLVCRCARKEVHTSIQVQRRQSGIPCAVVGTVSFALSSGTGLSCPRRLQIVPADLASASGGRDHATSPYAKVPFVVRHLRVHRCPASRFVTIAIRPSGRGGMARTILPFGILKKRNIFRSRAGHAFFMPRTDLPDGRRLHPKAGPSVILLQIEC